MSELRGLGEANAELQRVGGRLFAIAVDQPAQARRVVQRNNLDFAILCDTDRSVIKAYGLLHEGTGPGGAGIALPANVLIDCTGQIAWEHVARKIQDRPHPDEVLAAVRVLRDGE